MQFKSIEGGNVIFPNMDEVHIIVAGNVIVYDHRQNFDRPNIIAYYSNIIIIII
jgi:hypothetical protein